MALHQYIERRRADNGDPNLRGIITALLPHAAARGITAAVLRWDPVPGRVSISALAATHAPQSKTFA